MGNEVLSAIFDEMGNFDRALSQCPVVFGQSWSANFWGKFEGKTSDIDIATTETYVVAGGKVISNGTSYSDGLATDAVCDIWRFLTVENTDNCGNLCHLAHTRYLFTDQWSFTSRFNTYIDFFSDILTGEMEDFEKKFDDQIKNLIANKRVDNTFF